MPRPAASPPAAGPRLLARNGLELRLEAAQLPAESLCTSSGPSALSVRAAAYDSWATPFFVDDSLEAKERELLS
jgi:hypothetical protein